MKLIHVGPVRVIPDPTVDGQFVVARRDGLSHVHVLVVHMRPQERLETVRTVGAAYLYAEAVRAVLASKKVPT